MAIEPNTVFGGVTIAGLLAILKGLLWLEARGDKRIEEHAGSEAQRKRINEQIKEQTAHLATEKDRLKTHALAKHIAASCKQCPPLTETTAIERDAS